MMLVDLLIEDKRSEEAFLVAEKAKARTLLDVLASERSSAELEIPEQEIAEQQRLERRVVEANRRAAAAEVEKARLDLESFRAALEGRHPRLQATRGAAHLDSVRALAPLVSGGGNALVEYVVGADRLHLFVVRGGNGGARL